MPEPPELPEIPDLESILPPIEELLRGPSKPPECPVCSYIKANVCGPHAKQGDPDECALEIKDVLFSVKEKSKEEQMATLLPVLAKYGIDPNAEFGPGGI